MLRGPDYAVSSEKRALDIAVASAMLIPAGVGLLAVKWALRHGTESPIFEQARVGLAGDEFDIFKLHTLKNNATLFSWAHRLRTSRLDETLQVWNILNGEMGACGHRPLEPWQHQAILALDDLPDDLLEGYKLMIDFERPGWFSPYSLHRYATDTQGSDVTIERVESEVAHFQQATLLKDMQVLCAFGVAAANKGLFERYVEPTLE